MTDSDNAGNVTFEEACDRSWDAICDGSCDEGVCWQLVMIDFDESAMKPLRRLAMDSYDATCDGTCDEACDEGLR